MNLAIVGSRNFCDYAVFCNVVNTWIETNGVPQTVVSGAARGADTLAARYAREHNIELIEHRANWREHGKAAGPLRNTQIVESATHMLAFPSRTGRGTQDSIRKARAKMGDKNVCVLYID